MTTLSDDAAALSSAPAASLCDGTYAAQISNFQVQWNTVTAITDTTDPDYDASVSGAAQLTSGFYDSTTAAAVQTVAGSSQPACVPGGGAAPGGGATQDAATITALQAIDPNPCAVQSATVGNASVLAFQTAWNAASGSPQLTPDGFFGPNTNAVYAAVCQANGISGTIGGACSGYTWPGQTTPAAPSVTPQPLTTPVVIPPGLANPPAASGLPTWAKWLLALLGVAAVGAIAWTMMRKPKGVKHKALNAHHAHEGGRKRRRKRSKRK